MVRSLGSSFSIAIAAGVTSAARGAPTGDAGRAHAKGACSEGGEEFFAGGKAGV